VRIVARSICPRGYTAAGSQATLAPRFRIPVIDWGTSRGFLAAVRDREIKTSHARSRTDPGIRGPSFGHAIAPLTARPRLRPQCE
jgi:hypothetical protein